jgi:type IV fimbrial biogenesis protein FimT
VINARDQVNDAKSVNLMEKYSMTSRRNKFNRGFNLLELMVALAVGGVLLSVGVPSFQATLADQRSTTAANELIESFILARSEAIKRGQYVSICKSNNGSGCTNGADWNQGWIVFSNVDPATPALVDGADELIRVHTALEPTLEIAPNGNIVNFVSFRPVGTTGTNAQNFSGTLTICDSTENTGPRGLLFSPSGRVQISRDVDHAGAALSCS